MNRFIKLIIVLVIFIFYYVIEIKDIFIPCLFKIITGISCPMCGISRAIKEILEFDFISAFHFNILAIFVFIFLILNVLLLIYDIIFNKNKIERLYNLLGNYYLLLVIILIFNMIINNFKGI